MAQKIGILALQGGFDLHLQKVTAIGAQSVLVKKIEHLSGLSGLILPGGESSVLLHLTDANFRQALRERIVDGLPVLATCAGLILIAKNVENPGQDSLGVLDIDVRRNAYGRQRESFIAENLAWEASEIKKEPLAEAVFIRAPQITRVGAQVSVLLKHHDLPILVKQNNIIGATFHPELSRDDSPIYKVAFPKIF